MRPNLVRVKPEGLEANLGSFQAEGGGDVAAGNGGRSGFCRGEVGTDGQFGVSVMGAEVNEAACCCHHGAAVQQSGGFHSGRFAADTILLRVEEEGDGGGGEKDMIRSVLWYNAICVMELHIFVAKLGGTSVGVRLGVFAGAEAKVERYDNEVGSAGCLCGSVNPCSNAHD